MLKVSPSFLVFWEKRSTFLRKAFDLVTDLRGCLGVEDLSTSAPVSNDDSQIEASQIDASNVAPRSAIVVKF